MNKLHPDDETEECTSCGEIAICEGKLVICQTCYLELAADFMSED